MKSNTREEGTSEGAGRRAVTFGKYRAIAELGVGGMAEVYLAVAHGVAGFSKLHVIKRLKSELVGEQQFLMMFLDEARLAARLNHPNIVQTYEVAVEGGEHFLVLEYVDGEPLSAIIRRAREIGESVPLALHLQIIHDMLGGLHYAHEAKNFDGTPLHLVHRDVSPHNVMVSVEGHVKLVDFGVAKAVTSSASTLAGTIKGKVRYLSPEQVIGLRIDRRSDLFAVGIMLWEAISEEKFWAGQADLNVIARLVAGDLPPLPAAAAAHVDEDLLKIMHKALELLPTKRYATAAEIRSDLADYLHARGRRPTEQAIGELVSRLFADRRALIRSAIESRQADFQADDFSGPLLDLQLPQTSSTNRRSSDPTLLAPSAPKSESGSARLAATADVATASGSATKPTRTALHAALILCALAALGFIAFGVQRWGSTGSPAVAPALSAASAAKVEMVDVRIEAIPTDALLLLDGERLTSNPFHGAYAKDDKDHVILVQADGFDEQRMTVRFSNDVAVRVALLATVATPAASDPAASAEPVPTPPRVSGPRIVAPPATTRKPANQFDPGDPWK